MEQLTHQIFGRDVVLANASAIQSPAITAGDWYRDPEANHRMATAREPEWRGGRLPAQALASRKAEAEPGLSMASSPKKSAEAGTQDP